MSRLSLYEKFESMIVLAITVHWPVIITTSDIGPSKGTLLGEIKAEFRSGMIQVMISSKTLPCTQIISGPVAR